MKLLYLLFACPVLAFAQLSDTTQAHQYYRQADSLAQAYHHDSAFALFHRAAGCYHQARSWERYVDCLNRQASCQYEVGRYTASLALAQHALRFSTNSLGKYHLQTAEAYGKVGDGYYGKNRYDSALACYQSALAIQKQLFGPNSASTVEPLIGIGEVYRRQHNYRKAIDYCRSALKRIAHHTKETHPYQYLAYSNIGHVHFARLRPDSAMYYYRQALQSKIACVGPDHPSLAGLYCDIGSVYVDKGNYQVAKRFYYKSLSLIKNHLSDNHIDLMLSYRYLGVLYHKEGDYDSALFFYRKGQRVQAYNTQEPDENTSFFLNNLGVLYKNKEFYDTASYYLRQALNINKLVLGEYHPNVAICYFNLGDMCEQMGAYELAESYCNKALRIDKSIFGENHLSVADDYYALGTVNYEIGNYPVALRYLEEAQHIYKRFPDYATFLADSYHMVGLTLSKLKKYEEAYDYHRQAVRLSQASDSNYRDHPAYYYEGIGDTYYLQRQYAKALKYYRLALSQSGNTGDELSTFHAAIAKTYLDWSHYDSALYHYQRSIQANTLAPDDTIVYATPSLDHYRDALQLLTALHGKATALEARYRQQSQERDLYAARQHYRRCDELIATTRHHYLRERDRIAFGETVQKVYAGAIRVGLIAPGKPPLLGEEVQSTAFGRATARAFYFAERSKAGALTLALADRRAKHFARVPDTLLTQEKHLKQERAFYRQQLQELKDSEDSEQYARYEDQLFTHNRTYDSLVRVMEHEFPDYHALKYRSRVRSLAEVRGRLDERTALLEYVLSDSVGYLFGVSQRQDTVLRFAVDSSLHRQLRLLRTTFAPDSLSAGEHATDAYAAVAYRVYRRLLAPVLAALPSSVDRLVVVPDGALSYLPFDMLLTEPVRHRRYRQWPYLLRHYAVSYAYSATLRWPDDQPGPDTGLLSSAAPAVPESTPRTPRLLALAPAYERTQQDTATQRALGAWRDAVVPLAWNRSEVDRLRRYLPGTFVTGEAAQEGLFKQQTNSHSVLHLAAHALLDEADPMQSRLVFSAATDSTEDGFLHAYELYGMDIPARLAVLSACHTGTGPLAEGEGLMSLARAFAYAGCPSVIMNRWSAHDASTSRVMDRLYHYLTEGYPKAEALRRAKLDFLAQTDAQTQFPAYWGGWMLVGDTEPLVSTNAGYGWLVPVLMVLLGGAVWGGKRFLG